MKPYPYLALLLVAIGGPSWFLLSSAENTGPKYVVFIDAGSSGSRAHIHSYTMEHKDAVPKVDASVNMKVKPGLSSYASNPHKAGVGLKELKTFLESKIEASRRPHTELHLQATAGLRVLKPEVATAILSSVADELETWGFNFKRSWARLITGREEGLNGWIATNYLEGVFDKPGVKQEDTFGLVEMGGASLQISYCPDNLDQYTTTDISKLAPVRIAGHTFFVYTYSYLNYGQEKAEELLSKRAAAVIEKDGNPCFMDGSPKVVGRATGDYDKCLGLIEKNLFDETTCPTCSSVNGAFQPKHVGEKFFAIENFFYTPEFFQIEKENNFVPKLMDKGRAYCKMQFDVAAKKWPSEDVRKYCFSSAFQVGMLKYGLGFTPEQTIQDINIAHEINGEGIDWALGAVINAITGAMDSDSYTNGHISQSSGGGTWVWFLCLVVVAGVLYAYNNVRAKKGPNGKKYSPLDRLV